MQARTPLEQELGANPYTAFQKWYGAALKLNVPNPNFMVLSTAASNNPNARVVLLKSFKEGVGFTFFTNYRSQKSKEMLENNQVSLLFFWDELNRQVRIKGMAEKLDEQASDEYFNSRSRLSKIGAWASSQSQTMKNRGEFEERLASFEKKFDSAEIERPPHWGGWVVKPFYFEFWQAHDARLHERLAFSWQEQSWQTFVLYP